MRFASSLPKEQARESRGWLVCDKEVCIYREDVRLERCIKHGAILGYRHCLTGAKTRAEARKRWEQS